jgi:phage shock protein A
MKLLKLAAQILSVALALSLLPISTASAAPSLNEVRTKIRILQEQAATAGEAALNYFFHQTQDSSSQQDQRSGIAAD